MLHSHPKKIKTLTEIVNKLVLKATYKQNGDLLVITLLHSATNGQKHHRVPLI